MRMLSADDHVLFAGRTSTAGTRRSFGELIGFLRRDNPVPAGTVLLTGTGIVPPDDLRLLPGQTVEITVPGIGTLRNPVAEPAASE
jgi:2-dehydro-3-deoxy-D-arabinonate dehydratase